MSRIVSLAALSLALVLAGIVATVEHPAVRLAAATVLTLAVVLALVLLLVSTALEARHRHQHTTNQHASWKAGTQ